RSGPRVLLPDPRARALHIAATELTAAGGGGDGVLAAHRHPERDPGRRPGRRILGQRRQALCLAGAVDAVVLGGAPADPLLLGVPGVAAVLGLRPPVARAHASLRAGLVL